MTVPIGDFDFQVEGPGLLICGLANRPPNTAASERGCHDCARPVWVSYSMLHHVDAGDVKPVCSSCGDQYLLVSSARVGIHMDQVPGLLEMGLLDKARTYLGQLKTQTRAHYNRTDRP